MTVGLLYDGINCLLTGNYYMMEEIVRERHASILTEIDHFSKKIIYGNHASFLQEMKDFSY
jgi:hypothetical protein